MTKEKWNKVGWATLIVLIYIVLLSPWIVYLCFQLVGVDLTTGVQISYWDALTNKPLYELLIKDSTGVILSRLPDYHWYNKFILYFFMILSIFLCWGFTKFLFWRHDSHKNQKIQEQQVEAQQEQNKSISKLIEKWEKKIGGEAC